MSPRVWQDCIRDILDAIAEIQKFTYGMEYASVVERENVWGAQFHPEKSGQDGLRMLANFAREHDHFSRD